MGTELSAGHALPKEVHCRATLPWRHMKGIGDLSDRGGYEKAASKARTPHLQTYQAAVPQAAKAFHLCPNLPTFLLLALALSAVLFVGLLLKKPLRRASRMPISGTVSIRCKRLSVPLGHLPFFSPRPRVSVSPHLRVRLAGISTTSGTAGKSLWAIQAKCEDFLDCSPWYRVTVDMTDFRCQREN